MKEKKSQLNTEHFTNKNTFEHENSSNCHENVYIFFQTLKAASQSICITDLENIFLFVNDAFLSTYGYEDEKELIGKHVNIVRSDSIQNVSVDEISAATIKGGWEGELVNIDKQGNIFPIHLTTLPIYDENNEVIAMSAIAVNLTEKKEHEKRLQDSQEKYKLISENSLDIVALFDKDLRLTYISPSFEKVSGYTVSELMKFSFLEIIHYDDLPEVKKRIAYANEHKLTNQTYEYRVKHKDGYYFWIETISTRMYDSFGNIAQIITSNRNITERKKNESIIKERSEKMTFLSSAATEMLELPDLSSIYEYICQSIHKFYQQTIVLFISIDESKSETTLITHAGLNNRNLKKITDLTRISVIGKKFGLTPLHRDFFKSGKLVEFEGGVAEFSSNQIPKIAADLIQKFLHIGKIYTIGINKNDILLGAVHLFVLKNYTVEDVEFIESFVKMSGIIIQRKLIEDKLAFQANILAQINDAVTVTDLEGNITYVNHAEELIMGMNADELIGKSVRIYGENKKKGVSQDEIISKTLSQGSWQGEIINYNNYGKELVLDVRTHIMKDNANKPYGMCGISTDITDRKLAEQQIHENELFIKTIANNVPTLLYIYDFEINENIWANDAHRNFFSEIDRESEDFDFKIISEIIHKDDYNILLAKSNELQNNPKLQRFELELRIAWKNDWKWMKLFSSVFKLNNEGKVKQILGVLVDIDSNKRNELALQQSKEIAQESEHKMRSMFENTLTGILYCDTQGNILEANPAVLKILGSPSIDETKKINILTYESLIKIGFSKNVYKSIEEGIIVSDSSEYITKWGKVTYITYYIIPIFVNSSLMGVWVNLHDLTDLWKMQGDLMKAKDLAEESDRLKTAFLLNMSHEIRTPMNGILGFMDLLKTPELNDEQKNKYIDIVNKSGERLLETINNIIEISRIESGERHISLTNVNVENLMKYQYNFFKIETQNKELNFSYNNQISDKETFIETDIHKINSILTNLIKNAIKFTVKGSIEFGNYIKNDFLHFYVKDTGSGIPQNRLESIFKRFVQADQNTNRAYEGSGLGLAICKAYVEALNGSISVESIENQGTTFHFSIPYKPIISNSEQMNILKEQSDVADEKTVRKALILVADDEFINFLLLEEMLKEQPYSLLHTKNGKETIQKVLDNADIDLVLMDVKMPDMSGYDAVKEIRKNNITIPIIAQTAHAFSDERAKAIQAGCDDYISKPIQLKILISLIQKYI